MKDRKFVALWAFILISGELIIYGRYYILFYKPYIPFKLVQAFHSDTLGMDWRDERYGWYYTFQYIEDVALEDVSISWIRYDYDAEAAQEDRIHTHQERILIKQMLPEQNFTVWTRNDWVDVEITYRKGTEDVNIERMFDVEDAVEVIPEEWRTPESNSDDWKKPIAHARAATAFPQILGVISLLVFVVVMSYFAIKITAKRSR